MARRAQPSPRTTRQVQRRAQELGSYVYNESHTAEVDGVETEFELERQPKDGTLQVFVDGLLVPPESDDDDGWTLDERTLTLPVAPDTSLIVHYWE